MHITCSATAAGFNNLFNEIKLECFHSPLYSVHRSVVIVSFISQLKLNKKSKYNLSDGEEDDHEYEAGALMGRDDFEDEMLPDDDDNGGGAETAGSYGMS